MSTALGVMAVIGFWSLIASMWLDPDDTMERVLFMALCAEFTAISIVVFRLVTP